MPKNYQCYVYCFKHSTNFGISGTWHPKKCSNCNAICKIGVAKLDNYEIQTKNRSSQRFWQSSRETLVTASTLDVVILEQFHQHSGISAAVDKWNHFLNDSAKPKRGRIYSKLGLTTLTRKDSRIDIARSILSEACDQYMFHNMLNFYSNLPVECHFLDSNENNWRTHREYWIDCLYDNFSLHWSKHKCSYPGCCKYLVIDANHKNKAVICANPFRYTLDLFGHKIPIGCYKYPSGRSRYCSECRYQRHIQIKEKEIARSSLSEGDLVC